VTLFVTRVTGCVTLQAGRVTVGVTLRMETGHMSRCMVFMLPPHELGELALRSAN
jgi:hypothetical protein